MNDEERIRQEAHRLWEAEGRPHGRAERHWVEAREIIALKDSNQSTLKPVEETLDDPVEQPVATQNLGDVPGLTDRGDDNLTPSLDTAREIADQPPLVTDKQRKTPAKSKAKSGDAKAASDKPAASKAGKASTKDAEKAAPKRKAKSA